MTTNRARRWPSGNGWDVEISGVRYELYATGRVAQMEPEAEAFQGYYPVSHCTPVRGGKAETAEEAVWIVRQAIHRNRWKPLYDSGKTDA